jgi:protein TonB
MAGEAIEARLEKVAADATPEYKVTTEGLQLISEQASGEALASVERADVPTRPPQGRGSQDTPDKMPSAYPQNDVPVPETRAGSIGLNIPLLEDTHYYSSNAVDVAPAALRPVVPEYPPPAVSANIQGDVQLLLYIDEFGKIRDLKVNTAHPPGYFEQSALTAFQSVQFSPAQKNGRAVKSRVLIRVRYELSP